METSHDDVIWALHEQRQQKIASASLTLSLTHNLSTLVYTTLDMDDPNTTITSQFGHSSQELMNLLLTGQAVSNVFDNSMVLSEDLTCKGIQSRPAVGYLSMLESLRYCEVGGYYKSPLFPIWVVGSTSHFSVLFGDEVRHIYF